MARNALRRQYWTDVTVETNFALFLRSCATKRYGSGASRGRNHATKKTLSGESFQTQHTSQLTSKGKRLNFRLQEYRQNQQSNLG
jgi:hypothetical protein